MRILLFHPSLLPPPHYGGIERIVVWLSQGLAKKGHEVWVGAYPESKMPDGVKLLPIPRGNTAPENLFDHDLPEGLDLVHFFTPPRLDFIDSLPFKSLVTIQGNSRKKEKFHPNTNFVSLDHAKRHGASAYVYNAVDPDEFYFEPRSKGKHLLFLSKTSWSVKNLKGAIRYCEKTRTPLKVAGGAGPIGSRLRVLAHRFTSPEMSWEGPVGGSKKAKLLAEARAFMFPVLWPEPFGIVIAEALVSGTPVLGTPRGSLPELVDPEVGVLLDSEEDWIDFLKRGDFSWDPKRCRDYALERFHYLKMTQNYESYYEQILNNRPLHDHYPEVQEVGVF